MAIQDLQTLVGQMARVDGILSSDRDDAIAVAVARYSKDRPRLTVEDVSAVGSLLPLPAGWVAGVSGLVELEYPVDRDPPSVIPAVDARLDVTPSGQRVRLANALPAGAVVRIRFTAPHTVDGVTDTIPPIDREAVAAYAAAHLLDGLAVEKSGDSDTSISAANVSRATPAQEYAARAKDLRRRYLTGLSIDPDRQIPAGVVVTLPASTDSLGRPRLFHPARLR